MIFELLLDDLWMIWGHSKWVLALGWIGIWELFESDSGRLRFWWSLDLDSGGHSIWILVVTRFGFWYLLDLDSGICWI
jgi:hypothetical protein